MHMAMFVAEVVGLWFVILVGVGLCITLLYFLYDRLLKSTMNYFGITEVFWKVMMARKQQPHQHEEGTPSDIFKELASTYEMQYGTVNHQLRRKLRDVHYILQYNAEKCPDCKGRTLEMFRKHPVMQAYCVGCGWIIRTLQDLDESRLLEHENLSLRTDDRH